MLFHEEFILKAPHAEAWQFFNDFPAPLLVIPGLISVKEQTRNHYTGVAEVRVGPFNFTFEGEVKIKRVDHVNYQMLLEGGARDHLLGAHFHGLAHAQTVPHGPQHSRVTLEIRVDLGGVIGKLGNLILKPRAHSIIEHYRRLCDDEIKRRRLAQPSTPPILESFVDHSGESATDHP